MDFNKKYKVIKSSINRIDISTKRYSLIDKYVDEYTKIVQLQLDIINDITWKNETRHLITPPPHENMPFLCRLK